ncbi:hypothetical protein [Actinomadura gamaensis]|uniref:Uncharacterized protein n=1 Tax=Actinomadura gamaensis TaxID=1763541 RepID=A0ABV9TSA6_9ACTN
MDELRRPALVGRSSRDNTTAPMASRNISQLAWPITTSRRGCSDEWAARRETDGKTADPPTGEGAAAISGRVTCRLLGTGSGNTVAEVGTGGLLVGGEAEVDVRLGRCVGARW